MNYMRMRTLQRFDYTVIGDNVNLASRLEWVNKQFGTKIVISEDTYQLAKERIEERELDLIAVPGREKPVRIFQLLEERDRITKGDKRTRRLYKVRADLQVAERSPAPPERVSRFKRVAEYW